MPPIDFAFMYGLQTGSLYLYCLAAIFDIIFVSLSVRGFEN